MHAKSDTVVVAVLVLPDCMASSVHAVLDIFQVANQVNAHQKADDEVGTALFFLQLLSVDGAPVKTSNGQMIVVDHAIKDFTLQPDVVIVSGAFTANSSSEDIHRYLGELAECIDWVKLKSQQGASIASACTGAFVLAEAGLFKKDQQATTHWLMAKKFQRRYPDIAYNDQQIVLEYARLFCAAATTAFVDLCIRLIQHFSTKELALLTAKLMLADPYRELQKPFHHLHQGKPHHDRQMIKAQQWLELHHGKKIRIDDLADHLAMGPRNFKRRFKQATGLNPLLYLQQVRVENAKYQLEVSGLSNQQIINQVGYEDLSSFGRLFKRFTSLTVEEYRRRFSRCRDEKT
ncbi:MAG: helix-turn-helix domain-containing protein [Pseudomonadales bacterium]|nr:helix-turn-helix domain-containing protein [Pseudomonadales bacterium]